MTRYDEYKYRTNDNYEPLNIGEFVCFSPKLLNILIYNLFIYSVVWRVSVSESDVFTSFKLEAPHEERLRKILKSFTSQSQTELFEKVNLNSELPDFSHFIFRPDRKLKTPNSGLFLKSINKDFHHLSLVDYSLFFYTDRKKVFPGFEVFDNNRNNGLAIIGLLSEDMWRNINFTLIKTLLNRQ